MTQRSTLIRNATLALAVVTAVSGCAYPGQNLYYESNVGYPLSVQFGTVIATRPIEIKGSPSGAGAAVGGAAGGIGGSALGAGTGSAFAALGLAVVGLAVGSLVEQAIRDRPGIEYTIALQNGQIYTLAQNLNDDDRPIQAGARVMLQYGYGYMRLLPADNFPTDMQRPVGITVH
jgi:outer membrane lipoprotein SlyB